MATMQRERRIECPRCHTITDLAHVDCYRVAKGREDDCVPAYRCRACGHVFAPRDLDAVKPNS